MYEEKKKYLDDAIDKLRTEAESMNGVFGGAVFVALVLFLLFAIPDITDQWRKGLPDKITKAEEELQLLDASYKATYKIEWACLSKEEREASAGLTEQQKQANKICLRDSKLQTLRTKFDWYSTLSEMRLSQEKGELLVKLLPALILAVFAGSLWNYRHLKTKEVELIAKRVELTADVVLPAALVQADDQKGSNPHTTKS